MAGEFETLVVVADGGQVRGFHEKTRHGALAELPEWTFPNPDPHGPNRQGGTVTSRMGFGRSNAGEDRPGDQAERRFLLDVANRLSDAPAQRLVLIAPAKALGVIREGLHKAAAARIELCDPHDCVHESAAELRQRLNRLRMPA